MIAWVALALALLELVVLVVVVAAGAVAWRKVAPTVAPLLSMFAPSSSSSGYGPPTDRPGGSS